VREWGRPSVGSDGSGKVPWKGLDAGKGFASCTMHLDGFPGNPENVRESRSARGGEGVSWESWTVEWIIEGYDGRGRMTEKGFESVRQILERSKDVRTFERFPETFGVRAERGKRLWNELEW
jgi:hypothetical protein